MALPLLGIALMAGAAYKQHQTEKRERQRDDEDRAEVLEKRKFERSERERTLAARDAVAQAYTPVNVTQEQLPGPTMPEEPALPTLPKAGDKFFSTPGEATDAAAKANDPMAQADRASKALLGMGDVAGAQAIRGSARKEKLDGLQLDEAQRKALSQAFDDSLQPLATHDAIAEMVSGSNLGGALQLKAVPSADGKSVEYHVVGADGSTKPSGYSFENSTKGLLEAKAAMSKLTPVTQKLEYLHKQDQQRRLAEKDAADAQFKRDEFNQRQPLIDSQVARNMADAAAPRTGGSAAAGSGPVRMDEPDKTALASIEKERARVDKRVTQIEDAILKAQADGMWDEAAPNAQALRMQLRQAQESLGALRIREGAIMRKYQDAAPADPYGLRAPAGGAGAAPAGGQPTVRPATQGARDRDRVAILQQELAKATNPADRAAIERELQRMGVTPAAPGAPAAAAPAAAPAPATPAAPAQAQPPGMLDRIMSSPIAQRIGAMGVDYTTPQGKALLQRRVQEAASGGAPLSEVETLRARQAGFL